jgi:hypothetical protein
LHISICKDTKHVYISKLTGKPLHDVLNKALFDKEHAVLYCLILNELGVRLSCGLNDIDPFHDYKPVEVSK